MADRPHVLLIMADQWPGALLGIAGHPAIRTPTLDQLARNGVRFTNAYSECPVCVPARRSLMTGLSPRGHGDRIYKDTEPMPAATTLARAFRDAGYQAYAVGKLHVFPQRDRIGFDDVILDEEGRLQYGVLDDYELFLGDQGYVGRQFEHGMSTDGYPHRPWHLPEATHVTNWATHQMARVIKRRDPTRPAFWYVSYRHPHPPLVPLAAYWDLYRDIPIDDALVGPWVADSSRLPYALQVKHDRGIKYRSDHVRDIRRAFYALCTHIDHQIRVLIGTLREEALLDETIVMFTSDHGDMLGDHGLWAKCLFYDPAAKIPMILMGTTGDSRVGQQRTDDRLVGLQDVMPTLLDMAGVRIPETVEGRSMLGEWRRPSLYGEFGEDASATRMIREGRSKLVYYPVGNVSQLFDIDADPCELHDLAGSREHAQVLDRLVNALIRELYGGDQSWIRNNRLEGLPARTHTPGANRSLSAQRGQHWPPPPKTDMPQSLSNA
jgi:arylsulfatase